MTLECIVYTHSENIKHKTSNTAMKPACAGPSWVGWPGKRVGTLTGREEALTSQLCFPSLSGLSGNQGDSKWLRAQGLDN